LPLNMHSDNSSFFSGPPTKTVERFTHSTPFSFIDFAPIVSHLGLEDNRIERGEDRAEIAAGTVINSASLAIKNRLLIAADQ